MTQAHILPPNAFYIVRHGESEANVRRVMAGGRQDSPLTETGIEQARNLASVIQHLPVRPSRIYHSPQIRAKHTAQYINNALQLDMFEIENLREHIFGDWENAPWEDTKLLIDAGHNPPNGETYSEFATRVQSALHEVFRNPHEAPPMLVAHGGVIRSLFRLYDHNLDQIGNCSLYYFEPELENQHFPWKATHLSPCPSAGLKAEILTPHPKARKSA